MYKMQCLVVLFSLVAAQVIQGPAGWFINVYNAETFLITFESDEDEDTSDELYDDGVIKEEPIFEFAADDFDSIEVRTSMYCEYEPETKLSELKIDTPNRRVSDIQCEYNMWEYKYRILENIRNEKLCDAILANDLSYSGVPGGKIVSQGDFPHMGAVGWKVEGPEEYKFMCGSSLISTKFALTAAHCKAVTAQTAKETNLMDTRPSIVRFGAVYIGAQLKHQYKDVRIEKITAYPGFRHRAKYNDVALIRFTEPVEIRPEYNIRPACLHLGALFDTVVNVTGWGATLTKKHSDDLLYAELDITDREQCEEVHYSGKYLNWEGLKDHQFCAGKAEGKVDTCQGDSGGPLQIQRPLPKSIDDEGLMYYVVGVTQFGLRCAKPNHPGIYVNVSDPDILCWIEKTAWPDEPNDFCSKT